MSKHFIFDMETWNQNQYECALIDCSYYIFDWDRFTTDNFYTIEELLDDIKRDKFSYEYQKQYKEKGFKVDPDTVDWWAKQDKKVRIRTRPSDDDITFSDHLDNLEEYLIGNKIKYWWSRGTDYDPPILDRITRLLDRRKIYDTLLFWALRDTRSFLDGFTLFDHRNDFCPISDTKKWDDIFEKHNSTHDIMADILRLQAVARLKLDLDVP